jgi:hypothetical protein
VDEDGEVLKSHHRERSDDSVGVSKDVEDRYSSVSAPFRLRCLLR